MTVGREVDLLARYPKTIRNVNSRVEAKTYQDREIARKFGKEFFDGNRRYGYGGYSYNPKFWSKVVVDIQSFYGLDRESKILDVGCAKGFMLHDFVQLIPGIHVRGIDVSEYAISETLSSVAPFCSVADARSLPFEDDSFDLVISINTLHNLDLDDFKIALKEVQRVSRKHSFITVDSWRSAEEREAMLAWNLTAKTMMSTTDWTSTFEEVGYEGDFYWFVP